MGAFAHVCQQVINICSSFLKKDVLSENLSVLIMFFFPSFFCLVLAFGLVSSWQPGDGDTKPNIVYILADDQGLGI